MKRARARGEKAERRAWRLPPVLLLITIPFMMLMERSRPCLEHRTNVTWYYDPISKMKLRSANGPFSMDNLRGLDTMSDVIKIVT